jgi:hypothetical protein
MNKCSTNAALPNGTLLYQKYFKKSPLCSYHHLLWAVRLCKCNRYQNMQAHTCACSQACVLCTTSTKTAIFFKWCNYTGKLWLMSALKSVMLQQRSSMFPGYAEACHIVTRTSPKSTNSDFCRRCFTVSHVRADTQTCASMCWLIFGTNHLTIMERGLCLDSYRFTSFHLSSVHVTATRLHHPSLQLLPGIHFLAATPSKRIHTAVWGAC